MAELNATTHASQRLETCDSKLLLWSVDHTVEAIVLHSQELSKSAAQVANCHMCPRN